MRGPKVPRFLPWDVWGISSDFSELFPATGQIPKYYSPVRHSSAPRSPRRDHRGLLPFDLHVLSMPPAFNLSQDQTLQLKLKKGNCPKAANLDSTDLLKKSIGFECFTSINLFNRSHHRRKRPHILSDHNFKERARARPTRRRQKRNYTPGRHPVNSPARLLS